MTRSPRDGWPSEGPNVMEIMRGAAAPMFLLLLLFGCADFGKVNQGRVIEYDSEKGLVTLVADSNYREPHNPKYDVLPPITIKIPPLPKDMGPVPEAGKLMLLDYEHKKVVVYDEGVRGFRTVDYTLVEQHDSVYQDDPRVRGVEFPIVDRAKKTISIYSPRRRTLVVISVPDDFFALPDDTWKAGDEIRYYYKDPKQALRLMNVTKTDVH